MKQLSNRKLKIGGALLLTSAIGCGVKREGFGDYEPMPDRMTPTKLEGCFKEPTTLIAEYRYLFNNQPNALGKINDRKYDFAFTAASAVNIGMNGMENLYWVHFSGNIQRNGKEMLHVEFIRPFDGQEAQIDSKTEQVSIKIKPLDMGKLNDTTVYALMKVSCSAYVIVE